VSVVLNCGSASVGTPVILVENVGGESDGFGQGEAMTFALPVRHCSRLKAKGE
jgi:hypothetical protein